MSQNKNATLNSSFSLLINLSLKYQNTAPSFSKAKLFPWKSFLVPGPRISRIMWHKKTEKSRIDGMCCHFCEKNDKKAITFCRSTTHCSSYIQALTLVLSSTWTALCHFYFKLLRVTSGCLENNTEALHTANGHYIVIIVAFQIGCMNTFSWKWLITTFRHQTRWCYTYAWHTHILKERELHELFCR